MRLFEAIIDANHRAVADDKNAMLHFLKKAGMKQLVCSHLQKSDCQ